jgi:hypothetical protein
MPNLFHNFLMGADDGEREGTASSSLVCFLADPSHHHHPTIHASAPLMMVAWWKSLQSKNLMSRMQQH